MDATTVIAIYAAAVASLGLGWQIFTWLRSHGTRIEVTLRPAVIGLPTHTPGIASINVRNRSEHPIRITSVGFDFQDGSGRSYVITRIQPAASIPGQIAARDEGMTYLEERECREAGIDWYRPLVAWATVATGETFRSRPTVLLTRDERLAA